jgi:hypothetical protein
MSRGFGGDAAVSSRRAGYTRIFQRRSCRGMIEGCPFERILKGGAGRCTCCGDSLKLRTWSVTATNGWFRLLVYGECNALLINMKSHICSFPNISSV